MRKYLVIETLENGEKRYYTFPTWMVAKEMIEEFKELDNRTNKPGTVTYEIAEIQN